MFGPSPTHGYLTYLSFISIYSVTTSEQIHMHAQLSIMFRFLEACPSKNDMQSCMTKYLTFYLNPS